MPFFQARVGIRSLHIDQQGYGAKGSLRVEMPHEIHAFMENANNIDAALNQADGRRIIAVIEAAGWFHVSKIG